MTMLENVLVGAHARGEPDRARERARVPRARGGRAPTVASLPYGTQKRVETARALVSGRGCCSSTSPPAASNHEEVDGLADLVRRMRDDFELTVLVVEHHMQFVMGVSDRVHVLSFGRADRLRHARRGAARPRRDRGLPRERRGCRCLS